MKRRPVSGTMSGFQEMLFGSSKAKTIGYICAYSYLRLRLLEVDQSYHRGEPPLSITTDGREHSLTPDQICRNAVCYFVIC